MGRLVFQPVTPARRADFEALFEAKGGPSYCWCMAFRPLPGKSRADAGNGERKAAMMAMIAARTPVGLIGYLDGEPAGWVSIAPRETYLRLGGPPVQEGERVWSLACMFVPRRLRGEGLAHELIAGAVAHARRRRATVIEAYPVDRDSPSYRFMGFVPAFEAAGFAEVARAGTRRHIMRLSLNAGADR